MVSEAAWCENNEESKRELRDIGRSSGFAEFAEHSVDRIESRVDLLSDLSASQDDLSGHEDEEHDFWFDHTIDQTREQLRLIAAELPVAVRKSLQTNGEFDVATADDVLDFEFRKLGIEAEFLNDTSVLA